MVKIYPCAVIKSAELYQWLLDGRYTPYSDTDLFEALIEMKLATPRWCRISRLIRDIPSDEIEAGNKITNLREELTKEMTKRGVQCVCLRCREIGRHVQSLPSTAKPQSSPYAGGAHCEAERGGSHVGLQPTFFVEQYETRGGTEYFLTYETPDRSAVFGFLRLRLPSRHPEPRVLGEGSREDNEISPLSASRRIGRDDVRDLGNLINIGNLDNISFIRELHVYGTLVGFGDVNTKDSQHKGLGKKLMREAERISKENNFEKIAVISGVGVRGYYRKLEYRKVGTYMVKML